MIQLPLTSFLFFLMSLIFLAIFRISLRMSEFAFSPSHLFIVWTSLGGLLPLLSGTGPASVRESRATNANQTETENYLQSTTYFQFNGTWICLNHNDLMYHVISLDFKKNYILEGVSVKKSLWHPYCIVISLNSNCLLKFCIFHKIVKLRLKSTNFFYKAFRISTNINT